MKLPEEKIVFPGKIVQIGGSKGIILPPLILEKLELEKGTEVKIISDKGKFGLFAGLWNPEQQKKRK